MKIRGNLLKGEARFVNAPIQKQRGNMKLTDYIKEHHNNNQSDFARSQGVSQSQARRWLKRNCVVIDGAVYCEVSKQVKSIKDNNNE